MEYSDDIKAILAKGASTWTPDEQKTISALVGKGHRQSLKAAMLKVRGGEKPQPNDNIQKVVS